MLTPCPFWPARRAGGVLLLCLLTVSPAAADETYVLDLETAVALKERFEDDVLILTRIRRVQESLITLNALRHKRGLESVTLPAGICLASPLAYLCPDLPATFGRSEP